MLYRDIRTRSFRFTAWHIVVAQLIVGLLGCPALAGPIGAAGDDYVIGFRDVDETLPAVFQYDGATGALVGAFATRNGGQYNGMVWGPNGNLFTTLQQSFGFWRVQEYDGQTGAFLGNRIDHLVGDFSAAKGLAFGPDGDLYVGDFLTQSVMRFDGTTFALKAATPSNSIGSPNGMRFAPNGELLVISGGSNEVRRFDVSGGGLTNVGAFASITGAVQPQDLTFGPNGNLFVSRGTPGGVAEFDGVTGAPLGLFVPAGDTNNGLAFDIHGQLLVSTFPTRVEAYEANTGAPLGPFLTGFLSNPTIISVKPVPEPATIGLLLLGGAALIRRR
jgi:WD40 repeat protein